MERKNKNFIKRLWYVNREEKPGYPKNLLPSDDDSLKEYVKKLKKGKNYHNTLWIYGIIVGIL